MIPVVSRKLGHSIALSIPKQQAIDAGVGYLSYQTKNDSILISSKIAHPFVSDITFQKNSWQQVAKEQLH